MRPNASRSFPISPRWRRRPCVPRVARVWACAKCFRTWPTSGCPGCGAGSCVGAPRVYRRELLDLAPPSVKAIDRDLRTLQAAELLGGSSGICCIRQPQHAHGMETRLPFLDYRLVEFAYRLPWRHKIRDGWTKHLIRRYLARHLSGGVAWRPAKLGFNAPDAPWLQPVSGPPRHGIARRRFSPSLLQRGVGFSDMPPGLRSDAYNVLHLASLLEWPAQLA